MAIVTFTDDVDADDQKRLHSINLTAAGVTSTVNIRRGSLAGAVVWRFDLAISQNLSFAWPNPLYIVEGVFIECTAAIAFGSADIH